ncbi:hypothetical protein N7462_005520 [Penicillium macrosclerotiorum]|uniref:uncharacterized protein n=1 Tax=Penicillium macrosclerotiorum TaxID=303699 RepID=UPI0025497ED6|nr:uncharacterized protein N7462_005520 [Penicillium macrosclerotiorum]KAJ5682355.1 hypothetical protein N7462_005520 [Penicillium macrosclerotiorum]
MATANYANPDSLAELSAVVDRTLLDTGRLFRKTGSVPASAHLQRSMPSYYESFQNALDNLSEQIFIAKAFLEKDYDAIKAREPVPVLAPTTDDVTMSEPDSTTITEPQPPPTEQIDLATAPVKVEAAPDNAVAAELPAPTEAPLAQQPSNEIQVKEEKSAGGTASADAAFPGTTEGLNFDSVLQEGGAPNSFDLNLDFGNDDIGNQAFLSGSAFGSTAPGGDSKMDASLSNEPATTAPAGGGAFDLELQKADDSNPFPDQGTGMEDIMAPGESSFDDLFMETENLGDNAGDLNQLEGDSLMNISELDDNWFT